MPVCGSGLACWNVRRRATAKGERGCALEEVITQCVCGLAIGAPASEQTLGYVLCTVII